MRPSRKLIAAFLLTFWGGCTGHRKDSDGGKAEREATAVYYATDRQQLPGEVLRYGPKPGTAQALHVGRFDVAVDHPREGAIRRRAAQNPEQLWRELKGRPLLIFVPGYNGTFDDGARRAALLVRDLRFEGSVLLFSWPSEARVGGYPIDESNALWAAPHLAAFLKAVAENTGPKQIFLVSHGLGARVVVNALLSSLPAPAAHLRDVALVAPDIEAQALRQAVPALRRVAQRLTLYASSNDYALVTSKRFQTSSRAGDTLPSLGVIDGVDTVEASAVDTSLMGNAEGGEERSVADDLGLLFRQGLPPEHRPLRAAGSPQSRYWILSP